MSECRVNTWYLRDQTPVRDTLHNMLLYYTAIINITDMMVKKNNKNIKIKAHVRKIYKVVLSKALVCMIYWHLAVKL